jgi:hypothetical protein
MAEDSDDQDRLFGRLEPAAADRMLEPPCEFCQPDRRHRSRALAYLCLAGIAAPYLPTACSYQFWRWSLVHIGTMSAIEYRATHEFTAISDNLHLFSY